MVNITLSRGQDLVTVPNIVGKSQTEAIQMLTDSGLTPNHNAEGDAYSHTAGLSTVIGMDASAGQQVARGTTVNYWLSLGPEPVTTSQPASESAPSGDGGSGTGESSQAAQ